MNVYYYNGGTYVISHFSLLGDYKVSSSLMESFVGVNMIVISSTPLPTPSNNGTLSFIPCILVGTDVTMPWSGSYRGGRFHSLELGNYSIDKSNEFFHPHVVEGLQNAIHNSFIK